MYYVFDSVYLRYAHLAGYLVLYTPSAFTHIYIVNWSSQKKKGKTITNDDYIKDSKRAECGDAPPVIPVLKTQRHTDFCEFKARLIYIAGSKTARATKWDSVFFKKKREIIKGWLADY